MFHGTVGVIPLWLRLIMGYTIVKRNGFSRDVLQNGFYMLLDACKRGFLAGCRPLICLDGCHIKTKFGGQLLTAVGMDPNDCIYPVAFAVVEVESFVTWKWFLESLKADLQIDNTFPWTIMTDKQKVLYLFLMLISYNICHVVCCSNICHLSGFNPST